MPGSMGDLLKKSWFLAIIFYGTCVSIVDSFIACKMRIANAILILYAIKIGMELIDLAVV